MTNKKGLKKQRDTTKEKCPPRQQKTKLEETKKGRDRNEH